MDEFILLFVLSTNKETIVLTVNVDTLTAHGSVVVGACALVTPWFYEAKMAANINARMKG